MSAAPILDNNDRDAGVVEEICGYLTEEPPRSYFFFRGRWLRKDADSG